ncbi:MAG: hypothetical protein ACKO6F_02115 [Cyanobium sp.]
MTSRRVWTPAISPSGLAVASSHVPQRSGQLFAGELVLIRAPKRKIFNLLKILFATSRRMNDGYQYGTL